MLSEEPCETTWRNYTERELPFGGVPPLIETTSEKCAELCAYNKSDCLAVEYDHINRMCKVHTDADDLTYIAPAMAHSRKDVYIVVRCNETERTRLFQFLYIY